MTTPVGTCTVTLAPGPSSPCVMGGSGNPPTLVGQVLSAFVLDVKITTGGALGTAQYSWRLNGGSWSTPETTRDPNVVANGTVYSLGPTGRENPVGGSIGLNARFVNTTFTAGDQWAYTLAAIAGTPTVGGSDVAQAVGLAFVNDEFVRLLEDRSGCPLPDPDADNSADITSWLAFAQRRFDAMAARSEALAAVFVAFAGGP